jgi:anthranilate phosphoribosyltransferase
VVAFNSGAALYLADAVDDLRSGVERALELIEDGSALRKLEDYIAFTRS